MLTSSALDYVPIRSQVGKHKTENGVSCSLVSEYGPYKTLIITMRSEAGRLSINWNISPEKA